MSRAKGGIDAEIGSISWRIELGGGDVAVLSRRDLADVVRVISHPNNASSRALVKTGWGGAQAPARRASSAIMAPPAAVPRHRPSTHPRRVSSRRPRRATAAQSTLGPPMSPTFVRSRESIAPLASRSRAPPRQGLNRRMPARIGRTRLRTSFGMRYRATLRRLQWGAKCLRSVQHPM